MWSSSIPIFVPLSARRREMTNLRTRHETNFTIMTRWLFSRGLLFRVTLAFPDCCWSASFFFDDSLCDRSMSSFVRGTFSFSFAYTMESQTVTTRLLLLIVHRSLNRVQCVLLCFNDRLQFSDFLVPLAKTRFQIQDLWLIGLNRINEFIHFFLVHHLWLLGGQCQWKATLLCNSEWSHWQWIRLYHVTRWRHVQKSHMQYVHVNKEHRCCEIVASEWDQVTI